MKKNARHLIGDLLMVFAGKSKNINKEEYHESDNTVAGFFEAIESDESFSQVKQAFAGMDNTNPKLCDKIIDSLENSLESQSIQSLRYAYHNLLKAQGADSDAIIAEDLNSSIEDLTPIMHRLESAKGIEKYAELNPDQAAFCKDVEALILDGPDESIKTAANLIKTVYSSKIPSKNIKLAYTTLETQAGEPYQMCPKAQKQIGYAIPMELSKCRDHCIDSRKTKDGQVTCAYQDWLRVVADNQESVMARLNSAKINNNEGLPLLNDITRPGPAECETPREKLFEDSKMLEDQTKYYSREDLLDKSLESSLEDRNLNNKQSESKGRILTSSSKINIKEASMSKKFNLQEHIKATSINDQLEEQRAFFKDCFMSESPSEMTNKPYDNSKYENATSMDALLEEKRTGVPGAEKTINESLEKVRKNDTAEVVTPQNETLNARRTNDPLNSFMKTLEEKLESKRHNKQ